MTFAAFEQLADPPEGRYELHHGEIVHRPPAKKNHFVIQKNLLTLLGPFLKQHGFLATEFPFRPLPEFESWVADFGFVSQNRWDADQNEYFLGAPDLVIEVLSKSNTVDEILDRQEVCFDGGCIAFWTVDPKRQIILVTTPDRKTETFGGNQNVPLPRYPGTIIAASVFKN